MKLAILGGSFNPVHSGHLYLADTVLAELGYGRVILIPALISPLKRDAEAAPARDRLDMILAAAAADPRLGVDDTEIQRGGVSFTIDTVDDIIERYRPDGKPGLVIGDDLAAEFPRWKNAGELAEKTDIIIAKRIEKEGEVSPPLQPCGLTLPPLRGASDPLSAPQRPAFPFPHISLQNAVLPVSSALIRERIASGGAWRSLVPQGARCIIEERGLYGCLKPQPDAEGGGEPEGTSLTSQTSSGDQAGYSLILALENAARAALKPSRFLHSRNTALMSCDLARRFGLDPQAAYLAGIGHDLGKALDDGELFALAKRDGKPFSALERKKPKLLHGRAAAVLLRERLGIHNKEVLEAVACHTSGKRGMGPLAQAVYIADKIEYSRRGVDGRFRESAAAAEGLGALFYAVLEDNIRYLEGRGIPVAEETRKLKAKLEKERDREIRQ